MGITVLIDLESDGIASIASPSTFGVLALLSGALVNFFVPSGGGQFAVQAPRMLDAAARLEVDPSVAITAISYGDQRTPVLSPQVRTAAGERRGSRHRTGAVFFTVVAPLHLT
ncbi:TIGR00366 family protein [uncultured Arthrobacter sp.]|uniref:TIGR00366 family protein n=1 Tax=uncultured Arthrobacter sp. TaxID=114050 RepID=UPI00345CA350